MFRFILTTFVALSVATPVFAEPLATVGKKSISRAEVEKRVRPQLIELDNARFEALAGGLDSLVAEALLEAEAEARDTTVEELVAKEVTSKIDEPTDEEITQVYEASKAQLGDATLDSVRSQIVEFLNARRAGGARAEYVASLREKYETKIMLEPPVVEVGVGSLPTKGPKDAKITIIAFSDYECPYCKVAENTVTQVIEEYGDKVRYAHRDYPLPFHANARPAAEAARCASEQGKFWEYHDALFEVGRIDAEALAKIAVEVGVETMPFEECLAGGKQAAAIDADMSAGSDVGVSGTPAFFINGRMLTGAQPAEAFRQIIDAELAKHGAGS